MAARFYALRACDEGVLFFPVYALLFADAGLSLAQISSLFVVWSVVSMALEVPSGAWADVYSRRRLLALAGVLRAIGYALWTLFPHYWAFAAGFVLWGMRSALSSGTRDALLYDELDAAGAAYRYTAISARAESVAIGANLCATALAAPALAAGGFTLVGAASVAVSLASAAMALTFPARPRVSTTQAQPPLGYLAALRAGLAEVTRDRQVRHAALIAAAIPGFAAFDEYLPLLARELVRHDTAVPLLILMQVLAMTLGALAAARFARLPPAGLAVALATGAALLAVGSLSGTPLGFLGVAAFFGVLQLAMVLSRARLQQTIAGPARATVLSVSNFGTEIGALAVFGGYALGSLWLPTATLIAALAVPLLTVAALTARWLPAATTATVTAMDQEPGAVPPRST